jgi:hypothetical protein
MALLPLPGLPGWLRDFLGFPCWDSCCSRPLGTSNRLRRAPEMLWPACDLQFAHPRTSSRAFGPHVSGGSAAWLMALLPLPGLPGWLRDFLVSLGFPCWESCCSPRLRWLSRVADGALATSGVAWMAARLPGFPWFPLLGIVLLSSAQVAQPRG